MKTHAFSIRTNSIICRCHNGNGNSIEVESFLKIENKKFLCSKCLAILKNKNKLYLKGDKT